MQTLREKNERTMKYCISLSLYMRMKAKVSMTINKKASLNRVIYLSVTKHHVLSVLMRVTTYRCHPSQDITDQKQPYENA